MTIMRPGVSDSLRHATPRRLDAVAAGIVLLSGVSIAAAGPQPGSFARWYAGPAVAIAAPALGLAPPQDVAASEPAATMPADAAQPEESEEDSKPAWLDPFSFEIVYTLTSDYI
ncbi:MAG: hypothetical protein HZB38_03310, partial [Planctomycetes bacterium]|nr:hypothetical protein [Planctomycetota bacterium]